MNADKMKSPFSNLFEQAAQISKAAAYDIVSKQVGELKEENKALKEKNKQLVDALDGLVSIYERNYPNLAKSGTDADYLKAKNAHQNNII